MNMDIAINIIYFTSETHATLYLSLDMQSLKIYMDPVDMRLCDYTCTSTL